MILEIAQLPIWYFVLMLIPCVNLIFAIIISIKVAEAYGKSAGFGIGLAFLGFIFWPILGFGDAQYELGRGGRRRKRRRPDYDDDYDD